MLNSTLLAAGAAETFVALDLEATGMDPARHEIIEVALVVFDRDGERERFSSLIRPRARLSLDISALTGIAPADVAAAPSFQEVAPTLRRLVAGWPVVGQSAEMDLAMLEAAGLSLRNPIYDTHQLATLLLPDLPAYSLAAIAQRLGVERGAGHRALADAETTMGVFRRLLEQLEEYDTATLEQVATQARIAGWPLAALFASAAVRRPSGPLFASEDSASGKRGPHELGFLTQRERPDPLRAGDSRAPVSKEQIHEILRGDGPLRSLVPHYEHRPQQEAMSVAVGRALNEDGQLLVEAGTGTGKSVAYLLPAALHATERGERVIVSTNTLALQDQLYRKDIPDIRGAMEASGRPAPTAAVLKGRQNYVCLRRWFNLQRQPLIDASEAGLRAKVSLWLGETETGDRAELHLAPEEEGHWRGLSADEEACNAARCVYQHRNQCFLFRARRNAEAAHIVVVNHALLLSDTMAGSRVLPEYEHLVVDEAHHLEDQATTQFGTSVDERALVDELDDLIRSDGLLVAGLLPTAAAFLSRAPESPKQKRSAAAAPERVKIAMERANRSRTGVHGIFLRLREIATLHGGGDGGYDRTVRITDSLRRTGEWTEVEIAWEALEQELIGVEEQIRWFRDAMEGIDLGVNADAVAAGSPDELLVLQHEEITLGLSGALRAVGELASIMAASIERPEGSAVYWVERSVIGDRLSLHAAPIHVGELLQDQLFGRLRSLVLTSATITTDGSFDFVSSRLGLEDAEELSVPSPFNYRRSTLLYLADDIAEPNQPGYQRQLQETLVELCDATRGRALILFTSHAALQATYRAIKRPLEDRGIIVLAQRTDGSPRQLIERLRHTPNVAVLGTATFWEGVDVVGPALSTLVITKLPFAVPSDPVFAARSELVEQPFLEYAVPQAVLKFKQGFGRLIRSSQDRGVCAVLDRRVLSKRYGASFVQSLPDCSEHVGSTFDLPHVAADWLAD